MKSQSIKSGSKRNDLLKTIGILSMLADHVGLLFFPQFEAFRIVGRLALPIFACGVSNGFKQTSNLQKYFQRLLVFSIISQIPYMLVINSHKLNILFTFALGLALLLLWEKKNYLLSAVLVLVSFVIPMDYGAYGVLAIFLFYFFKNKMLQVVFFILLTLAYSVILQWYIQLFAIAGVLIILYFPANLIKIRLPKYFFYLFYPVHLAILVLIKILIITQK